jgi:hypothetical protein
MAEKQESPSEALDLLRDHALALAGELSGGASKAIEVETRAAYEVVKAVLDRMEAMVTATEDAIADVLATGHYAVPGMLVDYSVPLRLNDDEDNTRDQRDEINGSGEPGVKPAVKHAIDRVERVGPQQDFQAYCLCGFKSLPYPNRQWAVAVIGDHVVWSKKRGI